MRADAKRVVVCEAHLSRWYGDEGVCERSAASQNWNDLAPGECSAPLPGLILVFDGKDALWEAWEDR